MAGWIRPCSLLACVGVALAMPTEEPDIYMVPEGRGDMAPDGSRVFPWSNLIPRVSPSLESGAYHSTEQILTTELDALKSKCDGKMAVEDGVKLASGPPVKVVTLGTSDPKQKIVYNFGIHGREAISAEIALEFMTQMCTTDRGKAIMEHAQIKVIPVLNIMGRQLAETGGSCKDQRKNGNGVDLNRNFDFQWTGGSSNPSGEDYKGPSALSEPESQFLSNLVGSYKPAVFVDIHSGDKSMLYPWSHVSQPCPNCNHMKEMLDHLAEKEFGGNIAHGPSGSTGNPPYTCTGVTNDFMHEKHGIEYSFIFEAYSMAVSNAAQNLLSRQQDVNEVTGEMTIPHQDDDAFVMLPPSKLASITGTSNHSISMSQGAMPSHPVFIDGECFSYFNPMSKSELHALTGKWSSTLMSIPEYMQSKK